MKRKCGTCKYFEDRGVANSGVCQHAQRRELRDVVLVRQSELACRNSWDQDLWEPASEIGFDSLIGDGAESNDVISDTGVGRRKQYEIFGGSEHVPPPSPFDMELDRVTDFEVGGLQPPAPQAKHQPKDATHVEDNSWRVRPSVMENLRLQDAERKAQRQQQHAYDLDVIGKRMRAHDALGSNSNLPTPVAGNHSVHHESPPPGHAPRRNTEPSHTPEPERLRQGYDLNNRSGATGLHGSVRVDQSELQGHQATEQLPTAEVRQSLGAPYAHRETIEPVVHVDGGVYGAHPEFERGRAQQTLVQPDTQDPIDQIERLRNLKRCCGTCRDFRQVGDSGRGQCVNPYAFSERRMVQSDQLTCRSSLGMWWMPNDDVWLESADTSHHGRPTPLLDAALKAQRSGEPGRDSRLRK